MTALPALAAHAAAIRAGFYLNLLGSLLLIPVAAGLPERLGRTGPSARPVAALGVAGAGAGLAVVWLPLTAAAGFTGSHVSAVATAGGLVYGAWFVWLLVTGIVLAVRRG